MPPDLTQSARPLSAIPQRNCEDDATSSPPPPPDSAEHGSSSSSSSSSSSNGGGLQQLPQQITTQTQAPNCSREGQVGSGNGIKTGVENGGQTQSLPQVFNRYRLAPKLRGALASVGATDSAYLFREVLCLLKAYLFKNTRLFDKKDTRYVNCESDPLGDALGVKRFHFNDVGRLISSNIIKVVPGGDRNSLCGPTQVPVKISPSASSNGSSLSNDSTCGLSVPSGASACIPVSAEASKSTELGLEATATVSSVGGASARSGSTQLRLRSSNPSPYITCPVIPDSCSDTETVYSVQGYETEYCRNTEFEFDSTEEEEKDLFEVNSDTFEEYEVPSDDAWEQKENYSDSDSNVDDVELAALAYTLVKDEVEEGFWADNDSDTDEPSSDEDYDPECGMDQWDCITCGVRNKPFVRYCAKCWQLRKNWLPDRPKKRKRKPRPKKKNQNKSMTSNSSEPQCSLTDTVTLEECKTEVSHPSECSTSDSGHPLRLVKTSSICTTVSLASSSQDSGFASSQDFTESQELLETDDMRESSVVEPLEPQPSTSKGGTQVQEKCLGDAVQPERSVSICSSKGNARKRKYSWSEVSDAPKRPKIVQKEQESCGDNQHLPSKFMEFLSSSEGKTWRTSAEGQKFFRSVLVSADIQEQLTEETAEVLSSNIPGGSSGFSSLCPICCVRPKNASIVHGRWTHQVMCYQCARRLFSTGSRCPMCRRKIHMVCKHAIG